MSTTDSNKEKFLVLCAALIEYFPDYQLKISEEMDRARFTNKADASKGFFFWPDYYRGKFEVRPQIIKQPDHRIGDVYGDNREKINSPSIGLSIDRPAEQIAKSINSRFMPDFEIYYAAWMKQWQHNHDYKTNKDATIKEVASLIGVAPVEYAGASDSIREVLHTYHSNNQNLKEIVSSIRVSSKESIKIETNSLNMEQARRLIEFIKGL